MLNFLEAISDLPTTPVSGKPAKLREAQLQLQRKLQQREHIKDQKHCLDNIVQVCISIYEKIHVNNISEQNFVFLTNLSFFNIQLDKFY